MAKKLFFVVSFILVLSLAYASYGAVPGKATAPNPTNNAVDVSRNPTLSWTKGTGTVLTHVVYFRKGAPPEEIDYQTTLPVGTTTWAPAGPLDELTDYYWVIVEHNADGNSTGNDTWKFTTVPPAPFKNINPLPTNGGAGASINVTLSWSEDVTGYATSHLVYFGNTYAEVNEADKSDPQYKGCQAGTTYIPGPLEYVKTYYWRTDANNISGTAKGDVWSFTTILKLDFNGSVSAENTPATTEDTFTNFILEYSGRDVNGIIVDLDGDLMSRRRSTPYYDPPDSCHEQIYRDMICGLLPDSNMTISLWGLGVDRDCNIMMYVYDMATPNRVADWTGNSKYLFTTDFNGGEINWPFSARHPGDYVWEANCLSDGVGRIVLESSRDPCSEEGQIYAYCNALIVKPKGAFTETKYAHRPQPAEKKENMIIDGKLKWRNGEGVSKHDLYFGNDYEDVCNASRAVHNQAGLLIYAPDLATGTSSSGYDPYGGNGFLDLDTTYYWRVDENTPPNLWKGDVWTFKTLPYFLMENFNSYSGDDLFNVWIDGPGIEGSGNGSSAHIFVQSGTETPALVRDGNSLRYEFRNDESPYYSEAYADIASFGDDKDWDAINAKSLTLDFYGKSSNPITEELYVTLTDGPTGGAISATVTYPDSTALREPKWHEWNIDLGDFSGVDLSDVARITIGFGEAPEGSAGTVYIENIRLYARRCALSARSSGFAKFDYAPAEVVPPGDCKIDYLELDTMANDWLTKDDILPTTNPGDTNRIVYYHFDEGEGNRSYPDPCDPCWTATFYNSEASLKSNVGVEWATPGYNDVNHCIYINGDSGSRITAGNRTNRVCDTNQITLSIWINWAGAHIPERGKCQGLVSKRLGWPTDLKFMMECDTTPGPRGSFSLRSNGGGGMDVYSDGGILNPFIGQWVHVAATYNGDLATPRAILYLNGDDVNAGPYRFGDGNDANCTMTIGQNNAQPGWPIGPEAYHGYLDEVRVYNRALAPLEIAFLADKDPAPGLYVPVASYAELFYYNEAKGKRYVNLKDYATLMNEWLKEEFFPRD